MDHKGGAFGVLGASTHWMDTTFWNSWLGDLFERRFSDEKPLELDAWKRSDAQTASAIFCHHLFHQAANSIQ